MSRDSIVCTVVNVTLHESFRMVFNEVLTVFDTFLIVRNKLCKVYVI